MRSELQWYRVAAHLSAAVGRLPGRRPMLAFGLACVAASAQASASPPAALPLAGPALVDCVEPPDLHAPAPLAAKAALDAEVHGNITVVSFDGDYSRGLTAPRQQVASRFYARHADAYDFLVVFTTFEFPTGTAIAFYNPVRNDVDGIGHDHFDISAGYGSAGRLQGYVDMAALARYDFQSRNAGFARPLNVLAHEIQHRWGTRVRFDAGDGESDALLGQEGNHWSLLVDNDASLHYGARWQEVSPGQFRVVEARQRFDMWDLYLAGFADAAEVPPLGLIAGSSLDASALPELGMETAGTRLSVSIGEVQAVLGQRVPDAASSQRRFRAAMVLLKRPGEVLDEAVLVQLERFALAFESYFQAATRGRAALSIGLAGQGPERPIAPPAPLAGSAQPAPAEPLQRATQWLEDQQRDDGSFRDRPATALRDTAMASAALAQVVPGHPALASARAFVQQQPANTSDAAAWRILASGQANPDDVAALAPLATAGIGVRDDWEPAPFDSALALRTHAERAVLAEQDAGRLAAFLLSSQRSDGSLPAVNGGPGDVLPTAFAARALLQAGDPSHAAAGTAARDWLVQRLQSGAPLAAGEAAELLYFAGPLQLPAWTVSLLEGTLHATQGSAGDWQGSVYTTALATLALALHSQPNLVLGDAHATPSEPVLSDVVTLAVRVRNSGGQPAAATDLQWYRGGPPEGGGTAVGPPLAVPALLAGESYPAVLTIEAVELAGNGSLVAVVDGGDAVVESNEDDNRAVLELAIAPLRAGVDAAFADGEIAVAPASFAAIGQVVQVSGQVRNLGDTAADALELALFRRTSVGRTRLAGTTVDLPAGAPASFALSFTVSAPGLHHLELMADPDDAVAEADEGNNLHALELPWSEAVDLALAPDDLVLTPSTPLQGRPLQIAVTVRNQGTTDAPPTHIELRRTGPAGTDVLQSLPLSVPATGSVLRQFTWLPDGVGVHALSVVVDPDDVVPELDEGNNVLAFDVDVQADTLPNLQVVPGSIQSSPDPLLEGGAFTVSARVRNAAAVDAGAFNVAAYSGDPASGGVRLASVRHDGGLAAGAEVLVELPGDDLKVHGHFSLFVLADSELEQAEGNEDDNLGVRSAVALRLPDLALATGGLVLDPPAPVAGLPVQATVEVVNLGEQPSTPAPLRLYQHVGSTRSEVSPEAMVPVLAPGASHVASWEWVLDASDPPDALQVLVDPENALREGDEQNNELVSLLGVQSGDAFLSEPYFSPNGDGVRDRTIATWRVAQGELASVLVRDAREFVVADLTGSIQVDGDIVQVRWDGRTQDGRVVPDGRYVLEARRPDGSSAPRLDVVVDVNDPMALHAVNSSRGILRELPDGYDWSLAPAGSSAENHAFSTAFLPAPRGGTALAVVRSHLLFGGREAVLSPAWLEQHARERGVPSIELESFALAPSSGAVVMVLGKAGSGSTPTVWTQDPSSVDAPTLVASLPDRGWGRSAVLGFFGPTQAVVRAGDGSLLAADLVTGAVRDLEAQSHWADDGVHVYPEGVVLAGRGWSSAIPPYQHVTFVPSDPLLPRVDFDVTSLGETRRTMLQRGAPRMLVHGVDESGQEAIDLLDLRTGQPRRLWQADAPALECNVSDPGLGRSQAASKDGSSLNRECPITSLRAFWLENRQEVVVIDHQLGELRRFTVAGDPIAVLTYPGLQREGDYAAPVQPFDIAPGDVEYPTPGPARAAQKSKSPNDGCAAEFEPSWLQQLYARGFARSSYDPASDSFFVFSGEVLRFRPQTDDGDPWDQLDYLCAGATAFRRIAPDSSTEWLGGLSTWPLLDAGDQARYPVAQQDGWRILPPAAWPQFIHADGTVLQHDGRVRLPGGTLTAPWSEARRLLHTGVGESRLALVEWREDGDYLQDDWSLQHLEIGAVFSTLDRLTAELRADSDGRSVRLSGIATDRNFDSFRIDYAHAESPNAWNVLVPPTRQEVLFDDFISWPPAAPGAYLFRLVVADRAGNTRVRIASADVQESSPITGLRQDHRAISPNGDGVQDAVQLTFSVARATEQRFQVLDQAGRVVFSEDRTFAVPGQASWTWDGHAAGGAPVPDGRYRIELSSGYQLQLLVDATHPTLVAAIQPSYPPVSYGFSYCADDRYGNVRSPTLDVLVERRVLGDSGWSEWLKLERCDVDPEAHPRQALTAAEHFGWQYRVVARDVAGNMARREFPAPNPLFALTYATKDLPNDTLARLLPRLPLSDAWQARPFDSLTRATIPLHGRAGPSGFEPLIVAPVPSGLAVLMADQLPAGNVLVDIARVPEDDPATPEVEPDLPLQWQTVVDAGLERIGDHHGVVRGVDYSAYELETIAMRLRTHGPAGGSASNAFQFKVGGVGACVGDDRIVRVIVKLSEPWEGALLDVPSHASGGPVLTLTPNQEHFAPASDLQYTLPGSTQVPFNGTFRVPLGEGRTLAIDLPGVDYCASPSSDPDGRLEVAPVVAPACDATATGQVRATVHDVENAQSYRLLLHDPALAEPRVIAEGDAHAIPATGWVIPTAGLPEGSVALSLELTAPGGIVRRVQQSFVVDRTAPLVSLLAPASGDRVCVGDGVAVEADLFTDTALEYLVQTRAPGGASFVPAGCSFQHDVDSPQARDCEMALDRLGTAPNEPSFTGTVGRLQAGNDTPTGTAELRLSAFDWSGAHVCAVATVDMDATARLVRRLPPEPRLPGSWLPTVSANPLATQRVARWYLQAQEPLSVVGELYATTMQGSVRIPTGEPLLTILEGQDATGALDVVWNAAGTGLDDGTYASVFTAVDDCGNVGELVEFVRLDSTPPAIDLTHPAPGASLRVSMVELLGSVADPHMDRWRVLLLDAPGGPGVLLHESSHPVQHPAVLLQWATLGRTGPFRFQVDARDLLGNAVEVQLPFVLEPRTALLDGVRVQPTLFSPNGDGVRDASLIEITLRRAALLEVAITDPAGNILAVLADAAPGSQGTVRWSWNGELPSGTAPDGDYRVRVVARDPDAPGELDEQELGLTVDTTPPAFEAITPADGGYARCEGEASFEVGDRHLGQYEAVLRGPGGSHVASVAGNSPGGVPVTRFDGLAEAAYTLELQATDGAGNRAERAAAFTLDCTPPMVELASPRFDDNPVIPRDPERPTDLVGTASDDHLLAYQLFLQPGDELVHEGSESVTDGLLHRWLPEQPDGGYVLQLEAVDRAGNTASTHQWIFIDGTPPVAEIGSPADGDVIDGHLVLWGTAEDDTLASVAVQVATPEDAAAGRWSTAFLEDDGSGFFDEVIAELTVPGEGAMRVRLVATDYAGFVTEHTITVTVDGIPPPAPLALTATLEGRSNVRLAWQGGDAPDLSGFIVYRDGTPLNADAPVTQRMFLDLDLADGLRAYRVRAIDHAGNESEASHPATVRVDRTPPLVAISSPLQGARVHGLLDIVGSAWSEGDFAGFQLLLEDVATGVRTLLEQGSSPLAAARIHQLATQAFAEDTPLRLLLRAADTTGNEASTSVDMVVDNLPPAAPANLAAVLQSPNVQLSWDPNTEPDLLGYLLYRNGVLVGSGGTLPPDLRPLALAANSYLDQGVSDGLISYRVYAIDRAGNVSPPSNPASVERDEEPPHLVLLRPQDGEAMDAAVEVMADSAARDIATVQFAWRAQGAGGWTDLGPLLQERPWRATFDPAGLEYGPYELTAVATDEGGLVDPDPPVVTVLHADLTPPAAPAGVDARADGDGVAVSWEPNADDDLAGYHVERQENGGPWQRLTATPQAVVGFADADRGLGPHPYRVVAVDESGNESPPSAVGTAYVFQPYLQPEPFSPTSAADVALAGIGGTRAGDGEVHVLSPAGSRDVPVGEVPAGTAFELPPLALDEGTNDLALRVRDHAGNRSLPAVTRVTRGAVPAAPGSLQGSVAGGTVQLQWEQPGSGAPAGYRLYRNGMAVRADLPLAQDVGAASEGGNEPSVLDGDPTTGWEIQAPSTTDQLSGALELHWPVPVLVGSIVFEWQSPARSARSFAVDGWFDGRWNTLATVEEHAGAERMVYLGHAYPTSRLRFRPLRAQAHGGRQVLAEVLVRERVLEPDLQAMDMPMDGAHVYQVAAVSALGFEGQRSNAWTAEVGDAEPPPPVQLDGLLDGRDALLSWTASDATDLDHYRLERNGQLLAQIPAAAPRSYRDEALPNGEHRYRVFPVDAVGNTGPASNEVALSVSGSVPAQPLILAVDPEQDRPALRVRWQAGEGGSAAATWVLDYSHSPDGSGDPWRTLLRTPGMEALHEGLQYGETLWYRVRAEDANGNAGPWSLPVAGTVLDLRAPEAPSLTWPTLPGVPVWWPEPAFAVCGMAGAGHEVGIAVNGTPVRVPVTARSADAVQWQDEGEFVYDRVLLPDGSGQLRTLEFAGVLERTGGSEFLYDLERWRNLQVGFDGGSVSGLTRWGTVATLDFDDQWPNERWLPFEVARHAIDAYGDRLLVVDAEAEPALWLDGWDGLVELDHPAPGAIRDMRFSADGNLAWIATDATVHWLDASDGSLNPVLDGQDVSALAVAPLEPKALVVSDDGSVHTLRMLALGEAPVVLATRTEPVFAAAWSPDGRQLALLLGGRIEMLSADDGSHLRSIPLPGLAAEAGYRLQWSSAWQLLAWQPASDLPAVRVALAGSFCLRDIPASAALMLVDGVATTPAGLASARSAPLQVILDAELADLQVTPADIQFLPAAGEPGRSYSALVTLRNRGDRAAPDAHWEAWLSGPGDTAALRIASGSVDLPERSARSLTLDLGVLDREGAWVVELRLDPARLLPESDETNNVAQAATWIGSGAALSADADAATAAPGEPFGGTLSVAGSTGFAGTVVARIVDANGALVETVLEDIAGPLSYGQAWLRRWSWQPAAGTLAGAFRLEAALHDPHGNEVDRASVPLHIAASSDVRLHLQPAQATVAAGDMLDLQFGLDYLAGNQVLAGGVLRLSLLAQGATTLLWQGPAGTLLPGYVVRRSVAWDSTGQPAGLVQLQLEFEVQGETRTAVRGVQVVDPAAAIALHGSLLLQPASQIVLGGAPALLAWEVGNAGDATAPQLEVRVAVRPEDATGPLAGDTASAVLPPGGTVQGHLALDALPARPAAYLATLEARDGQGPWQLLAQLGVNSVDALAPSIVLLSPPGDRPQRMPSLLAADIVDQHSGVARAEYLLDGGTWMALGAAGNRYQSLLAGLSDGAHTVQLRALDSWGNERITPVHAFVADSMPPSITITGVEDGQLSRLPLTPVVDAHDVHLDQLAVWLDGQAFASGSQVAAEGPHLLTASAVDLAGNRSTVELGFTIDATPPPLSIVLPVDGTVVTTPQVDVLVASEPDAVVQVSSGTWQASVVADADGMAVFAGVPLAPGDNTVSAEARDLAGNVAGPGQVAVFFQVLSGELVGTIVPSGPELARGSPLAAIVEVENGTSDDFAALPLRVRALAAQLEPLAEWTVAPPLAPGAGFSGSLSFATGTWPLGAVVLELAAERDGSWQVLASAAVMLLDRQPPDLLPLAPDAGSLLRTPVTLRAAASDDDAIAVVEARLDDGGWFPLVQDGGAWSGSVAPADGVHAVSFRATDAGGNSTIAGPVSFTVDDTAPQIMVTGIEDGGLYGEPVQPVVAVQDAHPGTLSLLLDGIPFASGTTIATTGSYQLQATATDAAGNTATRTLDFELDLEPPVVSIGYPADGALVETPSTAVAGSTEPFALVRVEGPSSLHSTAADAEGQFSVDGVALEDGVNTLRAIATDRLQRESAPAFVTVHHAANGNGGLQGSLVVRPDPLPSGTPLSLSLVLSEQAGLSRDALPVRLRVLRASGATLAERSLTVPLPAQGSAEASEVFASTDWMPGSHRAELEAEVDGSWRMLATASFVVADRTPPELAYLDPSPDSVHANAVVVRLQASDALGTVEQVEARVGQAAWQALQRQGIEWTGTLDAPTDGPVTLLARGRDDSGNLSAPIARRVVFDATPPAITITGVSEGAVVNHPVAPVVTVEDATATSTTILLDGSPWQSGGTVAAEGGHRLEVESRDLAGNEARRSVSFGIDMTPPVVTLLAPADGSTVPAGRVDVVGRTEPRAAVVLRNGDGSWTVQADASGSFVASGVSIHAGANRISAQATDAAGNTGPSAEAVVHGAGAGAPVPPREPRIIPGAEREWLALLAVALLLFGALRVRRREDAR